MISHASPTIPALFLQEADPPPPDRDRSLMSTRLGQDGGPGPGVESLRYVLTETA